MQKAALSSKKAILKLVFLYFSLFLLTMSIGYVLGKRIFPKSSEVAYLSTQVETMEAGKSKGSVQGVQTVVSFPEWILGVIGL